MNRQIILKIELVEADTDVFSSQHPATMKTSATRGATITARFTVAPFRGVRPFGECDEGRQTELHHPFIQHTPTRARKIFVHRNLNAGVSASRILSEAHF
jgi:hypothetical protein